MQRLAVLAFLVEMAVTFAAIRAENWPEFRGPDRQGNSSEKNLPLKWSQQENIRWKAPIPGDAWSTPIIWGDRVRWTPTIGQFFAVS